LMGFKLEDKAAHFAAYCVLSLYHLQVYPKKTIWTILFLSGFGVTMELLQSLTTYRSFEVWDIVANMTGIFGGLGLVFTPLGQSLKWIEKSWNRKNEAK
ncbi:MAG: VanZ family protein, partial [Deltaproteobacteria bacterium]|nr:VanZ family protein [Deltaproteobacteria bacterium]